MTNLQLTRESFARTIRARNEALAAADKANKIVAMCEDDVIIATGILNRAIDNDLAAMQSPV